MNATITEVIVGASPTELFVHLATLDRYPPWMRLVHAVEAVNEDTEQGNLAWLVQLRAKVGPFTRSKQLRMERTEFVPQRRVRFERVEQDRRQHAEWLLIAEVNPQPVLSADGVAGAELTVQLAYSGELWTAGVLGRILDDEIRRSTRALTALAAATRSTH